MMLATRQTGMGNLVTRAIVDAQWFLLPTETQTRLQQAVNNRQAHARWLSRAIDDHNAWRRQALTDNRVTQAEIILGDIRGTLVGMDDIVRRAAEDAKADGHNLTITNDSVGLGVAPLLVIVVAAAVVIIVCKYIAVRGQNKDTLLQMEAYLGAAKAQFEALLAAGRADLIPNVNNNPGGGGNSGAGANGGVSPWLVTGLGALVVAGVVGVAFSMGGSRRR